LGPKGRKQRERCRAEVQGGIYAHSTKKHEGMIGAESTAKVFGGLVGDTVTLRRGMVVEYDPGIRNMNHLPGGRGRATSRWLKWSPGACFDPRARWP